MKGIILAGGSGTRLYPMTKYISKQLLPLYDKPMVYYPLSVLMLADIKEILIISNPESLLLYEILLGDGSDIGLKIEYAVQQKPGGLAEALIIGSTFVGDDSVCLILGDNVLYGQGLTTILNNARNITQNDDEAVVFGIEVKNPKEYGVAELNTSGEIVSLEEKPKNPKSNNAVIGLYMYPNQALSLVKDIKRSARGEKEITSLNEKFLKINKLSYKQLGRGFIWFDTGTPRSLKEATDFVQSVQLRQGKKIACIEEIALKKGFISEKKLNSIITNIGDNEYSAYLYKVITRLK